MAGDINAPGAAGFIAWLERYQPDLLRIARPRALGAQLAGLGQDIAAGTTSSTTGGTMLDVLKNAVTIASQAYLTKTQLDAQKRILDLQVARAQQGLPPLDIDPGAYGVPRVSVGVTDDTKKFLMYGGIGLGLLLLFNMMGRRRHA